MDSTTPLKAIRAKCLDCCCGSFYEIKLCNIQDCALYPFRLGKNPYRKKREYSEMELKRRIEILKIARENKNKLNF